MVGLQTLDLAIGVRVPASQPNRIKHLRAAQKLSRPFCVPIACNSPHLIARMPLSGSEGGHNELPSFGSASYIRNCLNLYFNPLHHFPWLMDEGLKYFGVARTWSNRDHSLSPDIAPGWRNRHGFNLSVSCAVNSHRAFVVWRSKIRVARMLDRHAKANLLSCSRVRAVHGQITRPA